MKRAQPKWTPPSGTGQGKLKLFNSLTRQKEYFVPESGNTVKWYNCGPTVYDASHMGHARSYISFDILRRVMTDYFKYDIFYCMNITDIDDKIIVRARQNYLYDQYKKNNHSSQQIQQDAKNALQLLDQKIGNETDADKKEMLNKAKKAVTALVEQGQVGNNLESEDVHFVLAQYLDQQKGSEVTDNSIFSDLPIYWEDEFHKDMEALNVLPPDVLTRVSDFIPEVITFIEKIIRNGYGYLSNQSVYFDTSAFDKAPDHFYAKMVPEAYGDQKALAEGEGELSISAASQGEKRNSTDFALWKASKPGEPSWDSPWGKGRPGWHIECCVMASDAFGETMDIHSGGVDLKFPHHDNELAQAEAHFEHRQWVHYFVHSGHLTIESCKMSKSLKNFITIKEVLEKYTARQMRFLCLLHSWKDTLDYNPKTMDEVLEYEKFLNEFFMNVKDSIRSIPPSGYGAWAKWTPDEVRLNAKYIEIRQSVHEALCDNIDTRRVMGYIRELISAVNIYLKSARDCHRKPNRMLLVNIAMYITDLLKIFGIIPKDQSVGFPLAGSVGVQEENVVMPYLSAFADFREKVRDIAKQQKVGDILKECDKVRDTILPNLGVRLEDHAGAAAAIKFIGK